MNPIKAIRNSVKLQEGSTKRGIAAFITGAVTLYMAFKGQPVDFDSILLTVSQSVEFWIGVGLNVTGLLGMFIPDEPKTVHIELPEIEFVGRAAKFDPALADAALQHVAEQQRLRRPVPPPPRPVTGQKPPSSDSGFGGGWNG